MDIDPQHKPMILGDNRVMKGVPSAKFGVVVYDPPHVGPQGRDKSVKRFDVDFGAGTSMTIKVSATGRRHSITTTRRCPS